MKNNLKRDEVPDADAHVFEIIKFAHSLNGYKEAGSFHKAAEIAKDESLTDLRSLRIRLFFCARARRHVGLDDDAPRMRSILEQIRQRLIEEGEE